MALLTNPNAGTSKFAKFLLKNEQTICFLVYCAGIIWFCGLAYKPFSDATYFSENALLPGLVRSGFNEDITAKKFLFELKEIMKSNPNKIPSEWLIKKFHEINIDAYIHNFTLQYPLINGMKYQGNNVYGILRAPRSSSTEGIIVGVPFRNSNNPDLDCSPSIALALALAKYCRKHKFWAKDIIFLITDHEQLGTQAWLQAYHDVQLGNGILDYGFLNARAGSIQAAINLEIHSSRISYIDVKLEGLNGQLPNLDLVNLVHKLCKNEEIHHTFKNRNNPKKKDSLLQQWLHSLITLFSMVWTQASGVPNGNHGLFYRFGIESVTLEGIESSSSSHKHVSGLYHVGRVLEGILRSLNNLLERFHQSYFFYLLPSNDRFIPIGSYMPSLGLIGAPLAIKGLIIWLKLYNIFKPKILSKNEKYDKDLRQQLPKDVAENISFSKIALSLLISHTFGWLFISSGAELSKIGFNVFGFSTEVSIYITFLTLFILSFNVPFCFKFNNSESYILNLLALVELATLLLTIALHNFSLSLILAVAYVPCVCYISPGTGWLKKILTNIIIFLIHPFIFIHLVVLGYTFLSLGNNDVIMKAFSAVQHSFIYFIIDEMIYGNWLLKVLFGFLTPNWILFWLCLHS